MSAPLRCSPVPHSLSPSAGAQDSPPAVPGRWRVPVLRQPRSAAGARHCVGVAWPTFELHATQRVFAAELRALRRPPAPAALRRSGCAAGGGGGLVGMAPHNGRRALQSPIQKPPVYHYFAACYRSCAPGGRAMDFCHKRKGNGLMSQAEGQWTSDTSGRAMDLCHKQKGNGLLTQAEGQWTCVTSRRAMDF